MVSPLKALFGSIRGGEVLDQEMNKAFLTMIPKPDKDQVEVGNYLLINNDLKLSKIMADRLKIFIPKYIHRDQVGFILGRQGPDQIRRIIDLMTCYKSE